MPPLNLYARVRFLYPFCIRDRGCSSHPVFPAPSDRRKTFKQTSGGSRRERFSHGTAFNVRSGCWKNEYVRRWPLALPRRIRSHPAQASARLPLRFCGEILGGFSHFLESSHLDLPDLFTRYVEFTGEVLKRLRFVGQVSCLEDAAFAVVQDIDRGDQRLALVVFSSCSTMMASGEGDDRPDSPAIRRFHRRREAAH